MSEAGSIKTWVLAFVVLCGVGFGTLVGVGCAVGANQCPFTKHKAQTSTNGQTLYLTNCVLCHGINGEGGRGDAPPLRSGDAVTLSLTQLEQKIAKGKPFFMPSFSKKAHPPGPLDDAQIAAIAQYVVTLRTKS
jgi:mono/diheme cytochrome c family protein